MVGSPAFSTGSFRWPTSHEVFAFGEQSTPKAEDMLPGNLGGAIGPVQTSRANYAMCNVCVVVAGREADTERGVNVLRVDLCDLARPRSHCLPVDAKRLALTGADAMLRPRSAVVLVLGVVLRRLVGLDRRNAGRAEQNHLAVIEEHLDQAAGRALIYRREGVVEIGNGGLAAVYGLALDHAAFSLFFQCVWIAS